MGYMDFTCREAISPVSGARYVPYESDRLYLGRSSRIYLSFDLSPALFPGSIKKAELILFKIPACAASFPSAPRCRRYCVRPLLDFFSIYSNWYTPPRTADHLSLEYEDQADLAYTEIDVTAIAQAWLGKGLENRGLLLTGAPDAPLLVYASELHRAAGMRPMLRLTCDGISLPLSAAPCTVRLGEK